MVRVFISLLLTMFVLQGVACGFSLEKSTAANDRPRPLNFVSVNADDSNGEFPRYLNELGIDMIRIHFSDPGGGMRRASFVWSGGSLGPDRFEAWVDGKRIGTSRHLDTPKRPYAWYREEFRFRLDDTRDHVMEIVSPEGYEDSAIEFAGIAVERPGAAPYRPLCTASVGSRKDYESALGEPGTVVEREHVVVFAPQYLDAESELLADLLQAACDELVSETDRDQLFKFSVEHYHMDAASDVRLKDRQTILARVDFLERFARIHPGDVPKVKRYTNVLSTAWGGSDKALAARALARVVAGAEPEPRVGEVELHHAQVSTPSRQRPRRLRTLRHRPWRKWREQ